MSKFLCVVPGLFGSTRTSRASFTDECTVLRGRGFDVTTRGRVLPRVSVSVASCPGVVLTCSDVPSPCDNRVVTVCVQSTSPTPRKFRSKTFLRPLIGHRTPTVSRSDVLSGPTLGQGTSPRLGRDTTGTTRATGEESERVRTRRDRSPGRVHWSGPGVSSFRGRGPGRRDIASLM